MYYIILIRLFWAPLNQKRIKMKAEQSKHILTLKHEIIVLIKSHIGLFNYTNICICKT